jgi:hypothetical protein
VVAHVRGRTALSAPIGKQSGKQHSQVLHRVARGLSNAEIAANLVVSEATYKQSLSLRARTGPARHLIETITAIGSATNSHPRHAQRTSSQTVDFGGPVQAAPGPSRSRVGSTC